MAAFIIYHMCNCQKYGGIPIWENCSVRSVRAIMPIWFYSGFVDSYSLPRPMPDMMLAWPYSALVTSMYILVQLPFIIERSAKNPSFLELKLNFTDYGAPPCTVLDHCKPLRSSLKFYQCLGHPWFRFCSAGACGRFPWARVIVAEFVGWIVACFRLKWCPAPTWQLEVAKWLLDTDAAFGFGVCLMKPYCRKVIGNNVGTKICSWTRRELEQGRILG